MLKPKEALIIDPEIASIDNYNQVKTDLEKYGIDLSFNLPKGHVGPIRHHMCLIKLPDDDSLRQVWLNEIKQQRDRLPSVLVIVSPNNSFEEENPFVSVALEMESYLKL